MTQMSSRMAQHVRDLYEDIADADMSLSVSAGQALVALLAEADLVLDGPPPIEVDKLEPWGRNRWTARRYGTDEYILIEYRYGQLRAFQEGVKLFDIPVDDRVYSTRKLSRSDVIRIVEQLVVMD